MKWAALLGLVASVSAQGGQTMLRFGCTNIAVDRLDPLVNPGQLPSGHMHQIVGGNAFNATMTTGDVFQDATCTSCIFKEDRSNYWTANMYARAPNGTYKRVPQRGHALQFGDRVSNSQKDGILVYYVSYQPGKVTVPQPGFRMLVGDPNKKTADPTLARQNCFRCYTGPNYGGDVGAPCMDARVDTQGFPQSPCPGGIRSNILFPTCWDGKNLDTPNHQDHVAYFSSGPANFLPSRGFGCPPSHPIQIPQVMYEVVWDTTSFNSAEFWANGNPFELSYGDKLGYGQHGDYLFGWDRAALQKAMDTGGSFGARGAGLTNQQLPEMEACKVTPKVNEDVDGWLSALPM